VRYFLLIFLFGCQATAQNESETAKKDREFQNLLSKVEENTKASAKVQDEASKKQTQIVTETVSKIITLKEENKDLKTELNEVKGKLDSVSTDMGIPIKLLPISPKKGF
jgi:seryl-tRNA synthetase